MPQLISETFIQTLPPLLKREGLLCDFFELTAKTLKVVLTVPAHFKHSSRASLLQCVALAGLPEICITRVVAEPIAAVFAFFWDQYAEVIVEADDVCTETYMVSDMGGGTYDFTLVHFDLRFLFEDDEKPTLTVDVFAIAGDNNLGGTDFTLAVAKLLASKFAAKGVQVPLDAHLLQAAESLKCDLCGTKDSASYTHPGGVTVTVTVSEYARETKPLTDRMLEVVSRAVQHVQDHRNPRGRNLLDDVSTLVMVGGAHMDLNLQEVLQEKFEVSLGLENITWEPPANIQLATTAVARGAACIAGCDSADARWYMMFKDVNPEQLRIKIAAGANGHDSCPIIDSGRCLDEWVPADRTFTNQAKQRLALGTVLQVFHFAQGSKTRFDDNTYVGCARLMYDDVRVFLGDADRLEQDQLRFTVATKICGDGSLMISVNVFDIFDGVSLTDLEVDFQTSGSIPPDLFTELNADSVVRRVSDGFTEVREGIAAAVDGYAVPRDLQRRLDAALSSEGMGISVHRRLLAEILQRRREGDAGAEVGEKRARTGMD